MSGFRVKRSGKTRKLFWRPDSTATLGFLLVLGKTYCVNGRCKKRPSRAGKSCQVRVALRDVNINKRQMCGNHEKICEKSSSVDQVYVQHPSPGYVTRFCWSPDYETAFVWTKWAWNTFQLDQLDILCRYCARQQPLVTFCRFAVFIVPNTHTHLRHVSWCLDSIGVSRVFYVTPLSKVRLKLSDAPVPNSAALTSTVEPGYSDIGLCDISPITSDTAWYQLIPQC
jgi:hypothetical protein